MKPCIAIDISKGKSYYQGFWHPEMMPESRYTDELYQAFIRLVETSLT